MTKPSESDQELLQFACSLADLAAEVTLPYFRQPLEVSNKLSDGAFDPVTYADKEAETKIRAAIQARYPDHNVVGEEHGISKGSSHLTWVLDPIDGTRAFISGLPLWGTLIALHDGATPLLGVMDQPFTGERFFANRKCTWLKHKDSTRQLNVSNCTELSNAIMMSTAPDMFSDAEYKVQQQLAKQAKLMRYGADSYAYCMLAAGYVDLVVESSLQPYDIQALIPIIQSAGGVVTDWQGNSAMNGGQIVAAATAALHAQALLALAPSAKKSEIIL